MLKQYSEYKDSEIEWLGQVPKDWSIKRLKFVADINPSRTDGMDDSTQCVFIPMEAMNNDGTFDQSVQRPLSEVKTGFTCFAKDDVIFAKITPCFENGKGALLSKLETDVGFGSTEFHVLRIRKGKTAPRFLYYLTVSGAFRRLGEAFMQGVAGQKRVTNDFVRDFITGIPSPVVQDKIADFLDKKTSQIDALITKKERMIELLKEERAAVINQAVTKGLDHKAGMKESGISWLGEIPVHWELKKLKYLSKKMGSGITPSGGASVYLTKGIPILRSQNIHFDGLRMDDVAYISDDMHKAMSATRVLLGDVLLNITGASIGRCNYWREDREANVNQHVCIIRPTPKTSTKFLYFSLSSEVGQRQIDLSQNGVSREGLNCEDLGKFLIPFSGINEQEDIVTFLEYKTSQIDAQILREKKSIELLKEYRTALISEAVTGKIDVRNDK